MPYKTNNNNNKRRNIQAGKIITNLDKLKKPKNKVQVYANVYVQLDLLALSKGFVIKVIVCQDIKTETQLETTF